MSGEHGHTYHAGTCIGHCRAQRFAMDSHCAEQFEKEKAAIKSYEDGWDRWDGPIWPWRETNNPQSQAKIEEEWQGCCNTPHEQVEMLAKAISKKREDSPVRPTRQASNGSTSSQTSSLWSSRTNSPCPHCGGKGAHL